MVGKGLLPDVFWNNIGGMRLVDMSLVLSGCSL